MKRVVLVGATDGIGRALAEVYLARGWRVGVVGRDPAKLGRVVGELRAGWPEGVVEGVVGDVTELDAIAPAFAAALEALGQMDLMIYCAGVNPSEADTPAPPGRVADLVDVNVRGAVCWLELGADYMAAAGRGRLAALGSMAGERGRRGAPIYGATKAALHTYLEGLRNRLHGSGVGVTAVKPGWVRTRMLDDEAAASPLAAEVDEAAAVIADAIGRGRDVVYVPRWWRLVAMALKATPAFLWKRFAPP